MRKNCINFKCNVLIIFPSLLEQTKKVVLSTFYLRKMLISLGYLVRMEDGGDTKQGKRNNLHLSPIFLISSAEVF